MMDMSAVTVHNNDLWLDATINVPVVGGAGSVAVRATSRAKKTVGSKRK
ncbi:hypothetical protein [Streptomyces kebangsaanensis]|nr:hypothetical protein [Streptomyces kebangsaanensis]